MSPFDIVTIISSKKAHDRDDVIDAYVPYVVNHALSNNKATLPYAELVNRLYRLPNEMQFDFYFHAIPKGYYKGQWHKEDTSKNDIINNICERLQCNKTLAKQYLSFLTDEEQEQLEKDNEGGQRKRI